VSRSRRCWDGAIGGLGNPVLAGVAEALANGVEPQAIRVLSIGSGGIVLPQAGGGEDDATAKLMQRRQAPSRARDLKKLTDALLGHPPTARACSSSALAGSRERSRRAEPPHEPADPADPCRAVVRPAALTSR